MLKTKSYKFNKYLQTLALNFLRSEVCLISFGRLLYNFAPRKVRLIDIARFSWVDEMINTRSSSLFNENYEGTDWTSPAISVMWSKTLLHFS